MDYYSQDNHPEFAWEVSQIAREMLKLTSKCKEGFGWNWSELVDHLWHKRVKELGFCNRFSRSRLEVAARRVRRFLESLELIQFSGCRCTVVSCTSVGQEFWRKASWRGRWPDSGTLGRLYEKFCSHGSEKRCLMEVLMKFDPEWKDYCDDIDVCEVKRAFRQRQYDERNVA